jgi:hypothetical protein
MGKVKALQASTGTSAGTVTGIDGTATAKSADYTVTDTDNIRTILMTTGGSNRTVTLPTATDNTNRVLTIKKVDSGAGTVIVDGEGSETIDGATTKTLPAQYTFISIQCDGSAWHIVDESEQFGVPNNSSAAAGYVGEYIVGSNTASTNYSATGVWGNYTSVTLTAGDWDVTINAQATIGAGGTQTYFEIGLSAESGATFTDGVAGVNKFGALPPTSSADSSISMANYRLSISAGNTYYMKFRAGWATTNPTMRATCSARRVR